jgi:tRNA(Arg) A34 adenosine deaminase TadA
LNTPPESASARKPSRRARRSTLAMAASLGLLVLAPVSNVRSQGQTSNSDGRRFYDAALAMKQLAESWGDQPYGAVLVRSGAIVGEGPSRVVQRNDADAHAEREAIKDAQRRLGSASLAGSVLYSTSRPCALCETAAAAAGVSRMVFGPNLTDTGAPRAH